MKNHHVEVLPLDRKLFIHEWDSLGLMVHYLL